MKKERLLCKNLHKSFIVRGRTINVLEGIDIAVNEGEVVVIKGQSGQGKTTLLWLLSGIDEPTSGEVYFEGKAYSKFSPSSLAEFRREKIGLIFQNFNLIPSWTALENVEAALLNSKFSLKEKHEKSVQLLEQMELAERLYNLPAELSVGQQQRVALARALINEPALIIADEPTGNVDAETAQFMLNILDAHIKGKKASMIVATHGNYHGIDDADRVCTLEAGKLFE